MKQTLKSFVILGSRRRKSGFEQTGITAVRVLRELSAEEFLYKLLSRKLFFCSQTGSDLDFTDSQFFLLASAREKAIVPGLCEARGKNVHKEPPDKLIRTQCHLLPSAAVTIIPPLKRNRTVFQLENTAVGNSHPVGIYY